VSQKNPILEVKFHRGIKFLAHSIQVFKVALLCVLVCVCVCVCERVRVCVCEAVCVCVWVGALLPCLLFVCLSLLFSAPSRPYFLGDKGISLSRSIWLSDRQWCHHSLCCCTSLYFWFHLGTSEHLVQRECIPHFSEQIGSPNEHS
jgi:hypothetical protein